MIIKRILLMLFILTVYSISFLYFLEAEISLHNVCKTAVATMWSLLTTYVMSFLIFYSRQSAIHFFNQNH